MNLLRPISQLQDSGLRMRISCVLFFFALFLVNDAARAMDFLSVADDSAILYDAPSLKAKKVYVVSRYTPLENVVNLSSWVKVRDSSGSLAWIEKRSLSSKRFVIVIAPMADVRGAPDDKAAVIAQAKAQVALERLDDAGMGWIKINTPEGAPGYIKITDVWGN